MMSAELVNAPTNGVAAEPTPNEPCDGISSDIFDALKAGSEIEDVDVAKDGETASVMTADGTWELAERDGRWILDWYS